MSEFFHFVIQLPTTHTYSCKKHTHTHTHVHEYDTYISIYQDLVRELNNKMEKFFDTFHLLKWFYQTKIIINGIISVCMGKGKSINENLGYHNYTLRGNSEGVRRLNFKIFCHPTCLDAITHLISFSFPKVLVLFFLLSYLIISHCDNRRFVRVKCKNKVTMEG